MRRQLGRLLYNHCMIDHDRLFKELLGTFFAEFVDLFFPDLASLLERDSLVFLEKELFSGVCVLTHR